ncbi:MAG: aminopeptidase [Pseudomonadota bacterium]
MKKFMVLALLLLTVLSGCTTQRSVSSSEYYPGGNNGRGGDNPLYKGELSEFDVLGIEPELEITEQDIAAAASGKKERLSLQEGEPLMLIQSGAMLPEQEMTSRMEKYFPVTVFTGVPAQGNKAGASYAKALRLAAAKAGIDKILVYWGMLETETKDLATKNVSWVPIVGWVIPDQTQVIHIRLKIALVDVKSGQWEVIVPKVYEDTANSTSLNRKQSDQQQLTQLKSKVYQAAVESIISRYMR